MEKLSQSLWLGKGGKAVAAARCESLARERRSPRAKLRFYLTFGRAGATAGVPRRVLELLHAFIGKLAAAIAYRDAGGR